MTYPRLELTDLPKDKSRAIAPLQRDLVNAYNSVRQYPEKMAALKATMKHVFQHINDFEKESEKVKDNG